MVSVIQLKGSGISPTIGIQNLSSTDKDWNPLTGIRNTRRVIQNLRLSWIPLLIILFNLPYLFQIILVVAVTYPAQLSVQYFIINKGASNFDTFKIQGWRRERKRCLKSEFAFLQSSSRLIQLTFFVKCRRTLLSWIPNNHIQGQKEKENFVETCLRPP